MNNIEILIVKLLFTITKIISKFTEKVYTYEIENLEKEVLNLLEKSDK